VPRDRLFALPEAAGARLNRFDDGGAAARLAGEHRGFASVGVAHAREVVATGSGLVVTDRLSGRGGHAVELRWPLASPEARIRAASAEEAASLARLAGEACVDAAPGLDAVVEVPLGRAGALLVALDLPGPLAPELSVALRSPGYGELVRGAAVVVAGNLPLPATLVTLFLFQPQGASP